MMANINLADDEAIPKRDEVNAFLQDFFDEVLPVQNGHRFDVAIFGL